MWLKKVMVLLVILIAGCDDRPVETTNKYLLPAGLDDCKLYVIGSFMGGYINVVRCPNSSVSTSWGCGKSTCHSSVIDGSISL